MSDSALGSHGTLIARAPAASPGTFTTIGELLDVTPPELMRNSFDATAQADNIDGFVMGVLRRGELTFSINFLPANATHDQLTGLYASIIAKTKDGFKVTYPDATTWVVSGFVSKISPKDPLDNVRTADVGVRPSGLMIINGTTVGS